MDYPFCRFPDSPSGCHELNKKSTCMQPGSNVGFDTYGPSTTLDSIPLKSISLDPNARGRLEPDCEIIPPSQFWRKLRAIHWLFRSELMMWWRWLSGFVTCPLLFNNGLFPNRQILSHVVHDLLQLKTSWGCNSCFDILHVQSTSALRDLQMRWGITAIYITRYTRQSFRY